MRVGNDTTALTTFGRTVNFVTLEIVRASDWDEMLDGVLNVESSWSIVQ